MMRPSCDGYLDVKSVIWQNFHIRISKYIENMQELIFTVLRRKSDLSTLPPTHISVSESRRAPQDGTLVCYFQLGDRTSSARSPQPRGESNRATSQQYKQSWIWSPYNKNKLLIEFMSGDPD